MIFFSFSLLSDNWLSSLCFSFVKRLDEDKIEQEVDALRSKLLANLSANTAADAKNLKSHDTHGLAAAKKVELDKMAKAFGTRPDYVEGDAFNKEKQEENKRRRIVRCCYFVDMSCFLYANL